MGKERDLKFRLLLYLGIIVFYPLALLLGYGFFFVSKAYLVFRTVFEAERRGIEDGPDYWLKEQELYQELKRDFYRKIGLEE